MSGFRKCFWWGSIVSRLHLKPSESSEWWQVCQSHISLGFYRKTPKPDSSHKPECVHSTHKGWRTCSWHGFVTLHQKLCIKNRWPHIRQSVCAPHKNALPAWMEIQQALRLLKVFWIYDEYIHIYLYTYIYTYIYIYNNMIQAGN